MRKIIWLNKRRQRTDEVWKVKESHVEENNVYSCRTRNEAKRLSRYFAVLEHPGHVMVWLGPKYSSNRKVKITQGPII